MDMYDRLFACFGPQHWWPGDTSFEVMLGAILTQSCSWQNVEKAIRKLKAVGLLSPQALREVPVEELAALVHPCGYFNVKAKKLKALVNWLHERYRDDIAAMCRTGTATLREELLNVYGIGEETADSILLYACGKPVFVIDAYTRRILDRIGIAPQCKTYAGFQALFMDNLPHDARLFNEYHALFVRLGKDVCRKAPSCGGCCLTGICDFKKGR